MEKTYIGGEKIALSEKENLELKYYILAQNKFCVEMNRKIITYGIEIESFNQVFSEVNKIEDITTSIDKINSIGKLLKENAVTPIHLNDVIEDLI
ncbi:MAG: hypothetical protein IJX99_05185 [Clostridia bacterium]|nr:hypothetical protein [Clostridia bacterium]